MSVFDGGAQLDLLLSVLCYKLTAESLPGTLLSRILALGSAELLPRPSQQNEELCNGLHDGGSGITSGSSEDRGTRKHKIRKLRHAHRLMW